MDGFSFHPYPNEATDPLERGYAWPNAGFVNLDRVKQALWDAFHGTAQPTTVEGLKLHLDEVGWQVDTAGRTGYRGKENVPVTDEVTQAAIYGQLIREAACDPDVASLSFFGYRDDGLRTGFQAGLARVDGSARPSAAAVQAAIAAAGCAGRAARRGRPASTCSARRSPSAARSRQVTTRVAAGEDARARVCVRSTGVLDDGSALPVGVGARAAVAERRAASAARDDSPRGGHRAVRRRGEPDAQDARRAPSAAPALTFALTRTRVRVIVRTRVRSDRHRAPRRRRRVGRARP